LKNGARPQEKLDAQAAVDSAQSEVERAKKDWDRAQVLHSRRRHLGRAIRPISQSLGDRRRGAEFRQRAAEPGAGRSARRSDQCPAGEVERMRGALKMAQANALEMKRREQELTTRARRNRPLARQPSR
jgi:hypothetical protein